MSANKKPSGGLFNTDDKKDIDRQMSDDWMAFMFFSELEKEEKRKAEESNFNLDFDEDLDFDEGITEDTDNWSDSNYIPTYRDYQPRKIPPYRDKNVTGIEINPVLTGDGSDKSRVIIVTILVIVGAIIGTVLVCGACFEVSEEEGSAVFAVGGVIVAIFVAIAIIAVIKSTASNLKKHNNKK